MSTYRGLVVLFALATMLLGVVLIAVTAWHGGGVGILLGLLFLGAGGGRLYLLRRRS